MCNMVEVNDEQERIKLSQQIGLKLLEAFDQVCKSNQINYFLDAGTLLGAFRNGKFIPWDDDIDIMMFREDFNKLKSLKNQFTGDFEYQDTTTDKYYTWYLPRLLWKNSDIYYHKTAIDKRAKNKLSLDIFIIDNAPKSKLVFKLWITLIKLFTGMSKRNISFHLYPMSEKLLLYFSAFLSSLIPKNSQIKIYTYLACLFNESKTTHRVVLNHSFARMSDYMSFNIFDKTKWIEFENKQYPVPNDTQSYLETHYGKNFRDLPPVKSRMPHPVDVFKIKVEDVV